MICKKCTHEASFDSPDDLCENHWIEWWVDGLGPLTTEEKATLVAELNGVLLGTGDERV